MIVRLSGVKRVRSKGQDYFYHRKTMTRLPGKPGSAEFLSRLRVLEARENSAAAAGPRTLGALITAYRASPDFEGLAVASRASYQTVFDRLQRNAQVPVSAIDEGMVYELRDKIAGEGSWSFANRVLKVLRLLFAWGIKRRHCKDNPAAGVDPVLRPRDAPEKNRPWTALELDIVLDAAPPWLRVAVAIAAYTGLRESDVAAVTWAAYDGQTFRARSKKTRVETAVPVHARLRAILDAAPRVSPNIVIGPMGRPKNADVLRTAFFRFMAGLVAEGRVAPGLSFHGLRHTLGTNLAEAGAESGTIASVLGHKSRHMADHYSRHARRDHLVAEAFDLMEVRQQNEARKTRRKTAS